MTRATAGDWPWRDLARPIRADLLGHPCCGSSLNNQHSRGRPKVITTARDRNVTSIVFNPIAVGGIIGNHHVRVAVIDLDTIAPITANKIVADR